MSRYLDPNRLRQSECGCHRYRLLSGVYPHERLTIVVMRDGSIHTIAYTSGPGVPENSMGSSLG